MGAGGPRSRSCRTHELAAARRTALGPSDTALVRRGRRQCHLRRTAGARRRSHMGRATSAGGGGPDRRDSHNARHACVRRFGGPAHRRRSLAPRPRLSTSRGAPSSSRPGRAVRICLEPSDRTHPRAHPPPADGRAVDAAVRPSARGRTTVARPGIMGGGMAGRRRARTSCDGRPDGRLGGAVRAESGA